MYRINWHDMEMEDGMRKRDILRKGVRGGGSRDRQTGREIAYREKEGGREGGKIETETKTDGGRDRKRDRQKQGERQRDRDGAEEEGGISPMVEI